MYDDTLIVNSKTIKIMKTKKIKNLFTLLLGVVGFIGLSFSFYVIDSEVIAIKVFFFLLTIILGALSIKDLSSIIKELNSMNNEVSD